MHLNNISYVTDITNWRQKDYWATISQFLNRDGDCEDYAIAKYYSLKEINKSVLPDYNIEGDKWLFQRLTKTFDIKMMKTLVEYQSFPDHFLSINMNVASILTKEFDQFIAKQKQMSEMPIILEKSLFDIMSDLAEYYIAQAKLKSLDCKICICRMDIQSLYVLDRELINVDFLKIRWNKTIFLS